MVQNMKQIIDLGFKADELNQEERNLISVPQPRPLMTDPMVLRA